MRLEEKRTIARSKFQRHELLVKRWFYKTYVSNKELEIRDLVLKWGKLNETKGKHFKFSTLMGGVSAWILAEVVITKNPR